MADMLNSKIMLYGDVDITALALENVYGRSADFREGQA